MLTKGEIRKIKLIAHEIENYKFEAVDNSTGTPLVLNNQAFTSVTLGDDPDRVMDVTISKPSEYFRNGMDCFLYECIVYPSVYILTLLCAFELEMPDKTWLPNYRS